jgi:uncharacterized protein
MVIMLFPLQEKDIFQTLANCAQLIMLIQNKLVGNKGMFYVGLDGAILAEMVYTLSANNKMVIEHTEVDDSLRGKGVGKQLVETAVAYARTHSIKIVPLCPFAKAVLDKVPAWQDALYR